MCPATVRSRRCKRVRGTAVGTIEKRLEAVHLLHNYRTTLKKREHLILYFIQSWKKLQFDAALKRKVLVQISNKLKAFYAIQDLFTSIMIFLPKLSYCYKLWRPPPPITHCVIYGRPLLPHSILSIKYLSTFYGILANPDLSASLSYSPWNIWCWYQCVTESRSHCCKTWLPTNANLYLCHYTS